MLKFLKKNALFILGVAAIVWMLTRPNTKTVPATTTTGYGGNVDDADFTATQINPDGSTRALD